MIVDASIVVIENTYRHLEMGKSGEQAAVDGGEEVWSAIVASTLTHIAVFVPLFFLAGVSSILFKQLSIVVIFALTMSLFVAVTLVPVLSARLLQVAPPASSVAGSRAACSWRASAGSSGSTSATDASCISPCSTVRRCCSAAWPRSSSRS